VPVSAVPVRVITLAVGEPAAPVGCDTKQSATVSPAKSDGRVIVIVDPAVDAK